MIISNELKDFQRRLCALYNYLKIEEKTRFVNQEELKTHKNDFWNDPKNAEKIMKQIKKQKSWIKNYETVKSSIEDLTTLYEFFLDHEVTEDEIKLHFEATRKVLEDIEFKM